MRFVRRVTTIPLYLTIATSLPLVLLALLPITVIADALTHSSWSRTRALSMIATYFFCEAIGIIAAGGIWLRSKVQPSLSEDRYIDLNFRLQSCWANTLYSSAALIFSFKTEVQGSESLSRGRFLLFPRHVSTGDTILPAVFVTKARGIALRYVLKKELLWDPCLDIVGHRLRNFFVTRNSDRRSDEIDGIRSLASDLAPKEGVLIYPEGTRFSEPKQKRIIVKLRDSGNDELAERAEQMSHVLPPRLGGPIALISGTPSLDIVFMAHTGFEGIETLFDLFNGSLIGRSIKIGFRRVPHDEIPRDPSLLPRWLFDQWILLDRWVHDSLEAERRLASS